jgi:uncharacterized protein YaaN involved in tellurite resistance
MPIGISDIENLGVKVGLAPAPATPITDEITSAVVKAIDAAGDNAPVILCRDQLDLEAQAQVHAQARVYMTAIMADPNKLNEVGLPALEEINGAANQLFTLFISKDRIKIPELNQYTKDLRSVVKGFNEKNERNQKRRENIEQYEKTKETILAWWNRNIDWVGELINDAKGVEARLDTIVAGVIDKQQLLVRNVNICNNLYGVNERAITQLIISIALMEFLQDDMRVAFEAFVIDPNDPSARQKGEQKDAIRSMAEQVEIRISEFRQRLLSAIATSPDIRNIRTTSFSVGMRLGMIVNIIIPEFKLTMVKLAAALEAQQGAKLIEGINTIHNEVTQGYAKASGEIAKEAARITQAPSTSVETLMLLATSLDDQIRGLDDAYAWGVQERRKSDQAIANAARIIVMAPERRTTELTKLISDARIIEAPKVPELPAQLLERASA